MSSSLPATVNLSIEELARHGGLNGGIGDGWGVAFYQGKDVFLVREAEPAASSDYIRLIQNHQISSRQVIAHIRRATQGAVRLANTQPFTRELGGRMHVFAHNGNLKNIKIHAGFSLGRFLPVGETDSEYAFCALLQRMESLWMDAGLHEPSLQERFSIFHHFATSAHELGPANFIYSDSDTLFIHSHQRPSSDGWGIGLHMLNRSCPRSPAFVEKSGVRMQLAGNDQHIFLAASVPLSDEAWQPMQAGESVGVRDGRVVAGSLN